MFSYLKYGTFLLLFGLCAFLSNKLYMYSTHAIAPAITLEQFKADGTYRDNMHFDITTDSSYKVATVKLYVDNKPIALPNNGSVGKAHASIPVEINTRELSAGAHSLSVEAWDASFNKNYSKLERTFNVDNEEFKASLTHNDFKIDQGKTVHLKLNSNKGGVSAHAKWGMKTYAFFPESPHSTTYECFLPIDCEENPKEVALAIEAHDAAGNSVKLPATLTIQGVEFKQATGFSISPQKLETEKENSKSAKILEQLLEEKTAQSVKEKLWTGHFITPLNAKKVVTPYGEIRTTREKGRYQHKAVDLACLPKSVVWATQTGKVVIKDRFLMSGNTIGIDHGHGILSLYYHLNDFADVEVGDIVKKGNPLGTEGMTGYASGYHLHWELRVNNVAVDPLQWTEPSF